MLTAAPAARGGGTPAAARASGGPLVYALSATTSGGSGDFKATSLAPSSTWQVGPQTGDFTYSYPMRVPPPVAGAAPSLALSYDSGSTDGETAQSNAQPGQTGEGFSVAGAGGYVEQRYVSCGDLITGVIKGSHNDTDQSYATGDECWDGMNATISFGGHSGQLIYDPAAKTWHLQSDDGSTVSFLTGAANGAYNGEHWEVITPDGTQYWFGLDELPGWTSSDPKTNSVWTMPVTGLGTGDPCHSPSYASSYCADMPWRWNLDLVVDPNGNATEYYYTPQTSYYAYDSYVDSSGTAHYGPALPYTFGGTLTDIYYGAQDNSADSNNAYAHRPFDVHFGYSDRCTSATQSTCAANKNGTYWPDTPWDLYCGSVTGCTGSGHVAAGVLRHADAHLGRHLGLRGVPARTSRWTAGRWATSGWPRT